MKFDRLIDNPLRRNRFEFDGTARLGVFEDFQIAGIGIAAGQRVGDRRPRSRQLDRGRSRCGRLQPYGFPGLGIVTVVHTRVYFDIILGHRKPFLHLISAEYATCHKKI